MCVLIPLIITLIFECIMNYILRVNKCYNYKLTILINVITNSIFNIIQIVYLFKISACFSACFGVSVRYVYDIMIYLLEIIIIYVESIFYNKYMISEKSFLLNFIKNKKYRCLFYSAILNLISYFGGKIIHKILLI